MKRIHVPDNLKPIPELDGYYATAEGRIFSTRGRQLRELSQHLTSKRRKYLSVKAADKRRSVHQLVNLAFNGPAPAGHETCHRNGQHQDNRAENLYWGTRKANVGDSIRHGTHHRFGPAERIHTRKLTEAQVIEIRQKLAAGGQSQRHLAKQYGVHAAAITYLKQGKTYANITTRAEAA